VAPSRSSTVAAEEPSQSLSTPKGRTLTCIIEDKNTACRLDAAGGIRSVERAGSIGPVHTTRAVTLAVWPGPNSHHLVQETGGRSPQVASPVLSPSRPTIRLENLRFVARIPRTISTASLYRWAPALASVGYSVVFPESCNGTSKCVVVFGFACVAAMSPLLARIRALDSVTLIGTIAGFSNQGSLKLLILRTVAGPGASRERQRAAPAAPML
jgi:hypothetical protein